MIGDYRENREIRKIREMDPGFVHSVYLVIENVFSNEDLGGT